MAGEKSNYLSNGVLALVFNATTIANIAINATSGPLANLYFSLHIADPTAAGNQGSSEVAYTSYARVAVARTSGGFTVTAQSVSPVAAVTFPTGTGGSGTATFFGIGVASSGATNLLYAGPLSASIVCGSGVTPQLTTATAVTEG